jgi:hypothetical protein
MSCAEMAEVQLMNMRRRTAAAPPFPIIVCAARGNEASVLSRRGN